MIRAHTIADVRAICGVGQGTKADDLTQIGDDVLQGRWLRLALMHLSYLREHQSALPINAELLRMLESLGSRWCRRFMLEAFLSREPLAGWRKQSLALANYSAPVAEQLREYLHVDRAILLGRGEALTSRDSRRPNRIHASVTRQILGVMCLFGGLPSVSKITKAAYQQIVTQFALATDWAQVLSMHGWGLAHPRGSADSPRKAVTAPKGLLRLGRWL